MPYRRRPSEVIGVVGPLHPLSAGHLATRVVSTALQAACDFYDLGILVEIWPEPLVEAISRCRADQKCRGVYLLPTADEAAISAVDSLDEWARDTGAADLIVAGTHRGRRRLAGNNCATAGILEAFREAASYEPGGKRAAVVGIGGFARSACFALAASGVDSLVIWDPEPSRAGQLAIALREFAPDVRVSTAAEPATFDLAANDYDLLVTDLALADGDAAAGESAWPVAHRQVADLVPASDWDGELDPTIARQERSVVSVVLPDRGLVCDLSLASGTPLLAAARDAGCQTLDGLTVLVRRVGAAFERLAEKRPPIGLMLARAMERLGQ